jgi:hypothetical protein
VLENRGFRHRRRKRVAFGPLFWVLPSVTVFFAAVTVNAQWSIGGHSIEIANLAGRPRNSCRRKATPYQNVQASSTFTAVADHLIGSALVLRNLNPLATYGAGAVVDRVPPHRRQGTLKRGFCYRRGLRNQVTSPPRHKV